MARPKMLVLAKTLLEHTRKGTLKWDATSVKTAFRVPLPPFADVQITKSTEWNSSTGEDESTYSRSISDEQGNELDAMAGYSGEEYQMLSALYDEARAGALGVCDMVVGSVRQTEPPRTVPSDR